MITRERWEQAHKGEQEAWKSISERSVEEMESKESAYTRHAPVMFLLRDDIKGKRILDIGGGPISILLHFDTYNSLVVDPILPAPKFIENYLRHGINFFRGKGEDYLTDWTDEKFDEVWLYNCLQHVQSPSFILYNLRQVAPILRISEPMGTGTDLLHPHRFEKESFEFALRDISRECEFNEVMYDYLYFGGRFVLK